VKGKVIIGNGGAEYGVRGYVSAYDAVTGKLAWRFYTTPNPDGRPDNAASDAAMKRFAGATWFGTGWKQTGGGGTVWDAIAYDPKLDILYVGVGNGAPWNHQRRSDGKGDNLFLSSILALKPDTGAYVWHYQTTPGESWDYTATQHIMLADLAVGGATRRVVMQAPKNGFFYVLDAKSGKLLSAEKYVPVNWAERVDLASGRPVENPKARYTEGMALHVTGPLGGHNWQPMAYDPKAGLVFIPAMVTPGVYSNPKTWTYEPGLWNTAQGGYVAGPAGQPPPSMGVATSELGGRLIAWDPVAQKARWTVRQPGPWNSGLLATAGGLVFGGAGKDVKAWSSASGQPVWSFPAGTGVIAAPMTYALDGEQYLAVMAGMGGAGGMGGIEPRRPGRLLVFRLGGTEKLAPYPAIVPRPALDLGAVVASNAEPKAGGELFGKYCGNCHFSAGYLPNLRTSPMLLEPSLWKATVYDGALSQNGMAGFKRFMTPEQAEAIRAFLLQGLKPTARR
jgi:quinohemoprotein ethanol dehydrogenase